MLVERIAVGVVAGLAVAFIMKRWGEMNDPELIAQEVPVTLTTDAEVASETMA